MYGDKGTGKAS